MDSNEGRFDPNEPDCTNGDFFCRLCLSSQNSESMWASHIAGKRHIKNAQKFPNGLPTRDYVHDEDSYERPAKRERFDDGYDMHDDYPKPDYEDEYYFNKRPPIDYTPIIKPNIVIDYGHTKKLEVPTPPPEINKVTVSVPPASSPVILPVTRPLPPDSPVDFRSVLDHLLPKSNEKPQVKDDFFEKINQREIAKEIAKEIVKKGISLDSLETTFNTSGKKSDDCKSQSDSRHDSSRDSRRDSSRDSRRDSSRDSPRDSRRDSARDSRRDSARDSHRDSARDSHRDSHRDSARDSRRDYDKHDKRSLDVFEILQKNKDKKKFRFDDEKESKEKNSSSKKSSAKSKSALDDLDPDELTTDVLDSLLSARLKPKKSENSDEICNKKHCMKSEVDLDDPKVIAQKLESLSTMEFLKIIHKKLVNVDLKSPEELKMLLKVIAEAQVAVCKKLPPELQALVKARMSMNDADNVQLPSQKTEISQNCPVATSSNAGSQNSLATVSSSSQTTISVNTTPTFASPQTSAVQYKPLIPPPIPNIPVSLNQGSISSVSNAAFPQNKMALSYASSIISNTPTVTPTQLTATPVPLTNVSVNNPASLQNLQPNAIHNYYNTIFSMYQNRHLVPSNIPSIYPNQRLPVDQRLPLLARFPPPPPPPPLPLAVRSASSQSQLSKEVLDAIAKIKAQQVVRQQKQPSSGSRDSPPKTKEEILQALKNLDVLQEEYKRKKLLKAKNESKSSFSEKSKSDSSSKK